jgi:hypothetical protein
MQAFQAMVAPLKLKISGGGSPNVLVMANSHANGEFEHGM